MKSSDRAIQYMKYSYENLLNCDFFTNLWQELILEMKYCNFRDQAYILTVYTTGFNFLIKLYFF